MILFLRDYNIKELLNFSFGLIFVDCLYFIDLLGYIFVYFFIFIRGNIFYFN